MSDANFANGRVTINKPVGERAPLTQGRKADYEGLADVLEQMTAGSIIGKAQSARQALWTPFEISVLLHYYYSEGDHPGSDTREYRLVRERLEAYELVEYRTALPSVVVTDRGRAFINMLLNTPLPVLQIVDPRTGQVVV